MTDDERVMYLYLALQPLGRVLTEHRMWASMEYGTEPCPICGEQSDVIQWMVGNRRAGLCPHCGQAFTD